MMIMMIITRYHRRFHQQPQGQLYLYSIVFKSTKIIHTTYAAHVPLLADSDSLITKYYTCTCRKSTFSSTSSTTTTSSSTTLESNNNNDNIKKNYPSPLTEWIDRQRAEQYLARKSGSTSKKHTKKKVTKRIERSWETNYELLKQHVLTWQQKNYEKNKSLNDDDDDNDNDDINNKQQYYHLSTPPPIKNLPLREWVDRQRSDIRQYLARKSGSTSTTTSKSTSTVNTSNCNDSTVLLVDDDDDGSTTTTGTTTSSSHDDDDDTDTDKMYQDRIQKLELLGYAVDPRQDHWNRMCEKYQLFQKQYNGNIPAFGKLNHDEKLIHYWCNRQKHLYRKYYPTIHPRKNHRTTTTTTTTTTDSDDDDERLSVLNSGNDTKRDHDTVVHEIDDDDDDDDEIDDATALERIRKLDEIGFVWNQLDKIWDDMYNKLKQYYDHHGDCLVPITYVNDRKLAKWVARQRTEYNIFKKNGYQQSLADGSSYTTMNTNRINRLNSINFEWDAFDARWMKHYNDLAQYVKDVGYGCRPRPRDNQSLAMFLRRQELLYAQITVANTDTDNDTSTTSTTATPDNNVESTNKSATSINSLTEKRIALLQDLGFLLIPLPKQK